MSRGRSKGVVAAADSAESTRRRSSEGVVAGRSAHLEHLVAQMVDIALDYLCQGGVLVPTVIVAGQGEPTIHLFGDPMDELCDLDVALVRARNFVDSLDAATVQRYVWAYDGYAGEGASHSDAIVMEVAERDQPHGWQLAVRYQLHAHGASAIDESVRVVDALDTPLTDRP